MNKKWLVTALTSAVLISGIGAVTISKPNIVEAATTHSYIWWSRKPRTVRVTKSHKIYEIQTVFPRSNSYKIRTKTLKRGSIVKINHGWSYPWIVSGHGLVNNYNRGNGRFWVTGGSKGWYSLNLHPQSRSIKAGKSSNKSTKSTPTYKDLGAYKVYQDRNSKVELNSRLVLYDSLSKNLQLTFFARNRSNKPETADQIVNDHVELFQNNVVLDLEPFKIGPKIKRNQTKEVNMKAAIDPIQPVEIKFENNGHVYGSYEWQPSHKNSSNNSTSTNNSTSNPANNNAQGSASNSQSSSATTSFQWPAGTNGYMAKAQYLFSLSGEQRHAADLELMKEMGELDSNGHPLVSISEFESHLREIYNATNSMNNWVMNGHN